MHGVPYGPERPEWPADHVNSRLGASLLRCDVSAVVRKYGVLRMHCTMRNRVQMRRRDSFRSMVSAAVYWAALSIVLLGCASPESPATRKETTQDFRETIRPLAR